MLLAIDVGNSNTVFAVHDTDAWRGQWRSCTDSMRTADEYVSVLVQWLGLKGLVLSDIKDCIISTVVPQAQFHLVNLSRVHLGVEPYLVGQSIDIGVPVRNIDKPSEIGADRLVNAVGAYDRHGGPLVVIDSGTATTFDIIGSDGSFEGGVIAPGISLSMRALHDASARLPRVEIRRPTSDRVIGTDTVSAMKSGVFWGYMGLIEGLVARIRAEYGAPLKVIATGGIVSIFRDATGSVDVYDSDVTIHGLLLVHRRVVGRSRR